jgi:hypothetical protein
LSSTVGGVPDDLLTDIATASAERRATAQQAQLAQQRWEAAIRRALDAGCRATAIARVAHITTQRVYQIGQKP